MNVSIDPFAGFCFGVENAVKMAEKATESKNNLCSLETIVHNQEEVNRLKEKGLTTINHKEFNKSENRHVLFRAHGEPPEVFQTARKQKHIIVDATCPVVLKLQKKIKKAYEEIKGQNGQIVIFGRKSHPEVIGLNGQTNNKAIIVENEKDISTINFQYPVRLFAQTTKSIEKYEKITKLIEERIKKTKNREADFSYFNTVCGEVTKRVPCLKLLSTENDVVIFVCGKNSSNGNYLYNICKEQNANSFLISSAKEINDNWFTDAKTVGISGATSTPKWLLDEIAEYIKQL